MVLLGGCAPSHEASRTTSKSSGKAAQQVGSPSTDADKQDIAAESGNATGWTDEDPRQKGWTVYWQTALLHIRQTGGTVAEVNKTHGTIYQKGQDASQFSSDSGTADQVDGNLTLAGNVLLTSLTNKATLRCDSLHYTSKGERIVKATGHVQVNGEWGTVSGLQEVWSTPDLKTFGTPDLFKK